MLKSINCKGKLIDFQIPKIMGILNVTPDSFFGNSRANDEKSILTIAEKMLNDGADFIDLGGNSTRPGAEIISLEEEQKRVIEALRILQKHFPEAIISVDTFRSEVAKQSIEEGACIINDVSGGDFDEKMFETVANYKDIPYILMHSRGYSQSFAEPTEYQNLVTDVITELERKIYHLRQYLQKDIIIDLGFGFSKNTAQNFELLAHQKDFQIVDCPILTGISRKSMIWKTLSLTPDEALNGTTALHMVALLNGSNILRVHDVKEALQTIKLFEALKV
ncbi:MAG: dihydropteroate synthase [Pseudarcicella sp.]|jgi:dihydropteroate synthase|nr:dihydropteroate synthase [Pseudarcicella sp.]MBP6411554.1 dihydropteroate synthase [Pseudarcicella sp.]